MPAYNLDPNGDLILVFCEETPHPAPEVMQLRVDSATLAAASPVFRAQLSPNFRDGQGLSRDAPPMLFLPRVDPKAMVLFCSLVHGEAPPSKYAPDASKLASIAVVADYYDAVPVVLPWLEPRIAAFANQELTLSAHGKLILASKLLALSDHFYTHTRRVLRTYRHIPFETFDLDGDQEHEDFFSLTWFGT
jgi:hypothetical protein